MSILAPPTRSTRSATIALTVIVAAQLMFVLDATVVNIALVPIQKTLHFSHANLAWVVDAYSLAFGGLLLLGGRLGDVFGRRRLFMVGLTLFTLSSFLGGLATTSADLLLARAFQGVGAALAAPSTLSLITSIYDEGPARNRALGVFTAVSAGGGSLGLLLGGALTSWASWNWVMFINVPIGATVVALAPRFVPEPPRNGGRLDVPGALLVTGGIGAIIYGFIRIAERAALVNTLALFVLGAGLLVGFVRVEQRTARPLFPLRLLTERTRAGAYAGMFLLPATMYGVFFFVSQYMETNLRFSAIQTGFAFLPLTAMIFTMSRITPRVVSRFGARRPLLVGLTVVSIAAFWIAEGLRHGSYASSLLGPLLLFGLGAGSSFLPISATILAGVPYQDAGAASGMLQTMQQAGGALGVAALSSVAASHGRSSALFVGGLVAVVALGVALVIVRPTRPTMSGSSEELAQDMEALPLFE